jgi:hypothetical protein
MYQLVYPLVVEVLSHMLALSERRIDAPPVEDEGSFSVAPPLSLSEKGSGRSGYFESRQAAKASNPRHIPPTLARTWHLAPPSSTFPTLPDGAS